MIYLKINTTELWMPKVAKSVQRDCNKDDFSPTTPAAPNRDLSAAASKSGIQVATATTTTKVSKLTASQQQQQQQQQEYEQLHQFQQKHATVITAEQQQKKNSLNMKMPTATAATAATSPTAPTATAVDGATIVSPTPRAAKRNSPTCSNNSSPTKEKSERILLGGHYTPQPNRERRESGGDRKDWDTHRQLMSPTTPTTSAVSSGFTTITPLHKSPTAETVPIPKQRSAYSPAKNSSSAAAKESILGSINQQVSEQRVSSGTSTTTTRLTGTTGIAAAEVAREEDQQNTAGGDGGGGAIDGTNTNLFADTAVAAYAIGAGSGHGDGEEYTYTEKQENETTTRKASTAESSGTYAATGRQMPSTLQATTAGSPTRANMSAAVAVTPLSPSLVAAQATQSQLSQQFHSKNEREQTYTEKRGSLSSPSTGNNSFTSTTKKEKTTSASSSDNSGGLTSTNNNYSASSSTYSPSNYVIPPLAGSSGAAAGSGSVKISSKLHNNQFIKNQQQQHQQLHQTGTQSSAATQSNITARYLKYKSHASHAQESAGGCETGSSVSANTNGGSNSNYSGLPGTYSPTKSFVAPTASAIKKKMVAVQEMKKTTQPSGNHPHRTHHNQQMIGAGVGSRAHPPSQTDEVNFDPAEDLSYGPGIVSKLRCRYLSLAFRESMEKERHCLDNMRRATSLNNLLDRDDQPDDDDEADDELDGGEAIDVEVHEEEECVQLRADTDTIGNSERKFKTQGGILKHNTDATAPENIKKTTTFQKNAGTFASNGTRLFNSAPSGGTGGTVNAGNNVAPDTPRSRHVKRGNDSLKRARSVEALLCERSPWQYVALNRTSYQPQRAPYAPSQPTCVTIEDKINNARSRLILGTDIMPPKRLTSVIDDTERPPPDLVKQTLKKFEATANRRGRGPKRTNGTGEVASKVATYKTIIKENKPAIVFPKPPLSPTKKLNTPLLAKPVAKPVVGATDLLTSPLGRKTAANAGVSNVTTPTGKASANSNVAAVAAVLANSSSAASGLSEHSPDIIPRHKLLKEKSSVVDSPVTALTKKLEKLRIDAVDKQQQQQHQTNETKQPAQLNKQSLSALEVVGNSDNEFVNNSELNNDDNNTTNKLVGGVGEGVAAGDSDAALEGNETTNNRPAKQHNDRAGTSAGFVGESVVEHDSVQAGTAAISSDLSDDDDGPFGIAAAAPTTKRITRTALDNIARAGTTQQFKFAGSGQAQKSKQQINFNTDIPTSVLNAAPGKQIGVIRPLPTTSAAQQAANVNNANSSISNQQQLLQQHMEALKQNNVYNNSSPSSTPTTVTHSAIYHSTPQLTSREIEKNRINEMKKTVALADGGGPTVATVVSANANSPAANASLNTVINTNAPGHKSSGAGAASSSPIVGGGSSSTSGFSELDTAAQGVNNSPLWALRIKRQTPSATQENTSMVFNFSNRKEVPDYIENDGVIFRRKRELPKPNESGFVLLGDLSLETSTDSDYDDFSMCPPSPCDVEFENANIVIDGKSSIRQKSKEATFRVQFNDTLTSTFEYPSEASLIIDDSFSNDALINAYENLSLNDSTDSSPTRHHHVAVDEIIQLPTPANTSSPANNASSGTNTPTKNILGNLPLDYPILDKGIMSQQHQLQQPQPQQLNQLPKREEMRNAEHAVTPPLSECEHSMSAHKSAEKTPLLQPQHGAACNASQRAAPLSPRAENSDKRDTAAPICAPTPLLPLQPPVLPQRPTNLPLPMPLMPEMATQKQKRQQEQQKQQQYRMTKQKPLLPVKRVDRVAGQPVARSLPAASKASPANVLPQFKLEAEMKQQIDVNKLTEAMNEEAQSTAAAKREERQKCVSGNLQCQQTVNVEKGKDKEKKRQDEPKATTAAGAQQKANNLTARLTASPPPFDARCVSQSNILRDFQLASVNSNESSSKNQNYATAATNNTAASGSATRHNNNNNNTRLSNTTTPKPTNITTTVTKKPLSKYTMFHTLFETSTTDAATTTIANSTCPQRPRKTPSVLNKPQYARFLQIDLAAATPSPTSELTTRQALLRTRSNEFQCGGRVYGGSGGSGGCLLGASMQHATPTTNQLMQLCASQQQRSASFSFGNNSTRNERAIVKVAYASVDTKKNSDNTVDAMPNNTNKKAILKSASNSLNGISTDDECFEDAIDFVYPIPMVLAYTSSYNNSNNNNSSNENIISNTERQNRNTTTPTTNFNCNQSTGDSSAPLDAVPASTHTSTVCTNNNNENTISNHTIITTLKCNSGPTTTLNKPHSYTSNSNNTSCNNSTNSSLTSSPTPSSSTTFYSYSSLSTANCTRTSADVNKSYKIPRNNVHNNNAVKCLSPTPYMPNKSPCNNNQTGLLATQTSVSYSSSATSNPSTALISQFSLPVASTNLLRSRIPGNTLYYV